MSKAALLLGALMTIAAAGAGVHPVPSHAVKSEAAFVEKRAAPSAANVISSLKNVQQSVEAEESDAKKALDAKQATCKAEIKDKKDAQRKAGYALDQLNADLGEAKTEAQGLEEKVSKLKQDMSAEHTELGSLEDQLSALNKKSKEENARLNQEIANIDDAIDKASTQAAVAKSGNTAKLVQLHNLAEGIHVLSEGMGASQPVSFLQASSQTRNNPGGNADALKADRDKLVKEMEAARESYVQESEKLQGLIDAQKGKIQGLDAELASAQPALARQQETIASSSQEKTNNERSQKRDAKLGSAMEEECTKFEADTKDMSALRRDQVTGLKMAISLLESMGTSLIQESDDLLIEGSLSFVQLKSKAGFLGGSDNTQPFDVAFARAERLRMSSLIGLAPGAATEAAEGTTTQAEARARALEQADGDNQLATVFSQLGEADQAQAQGSDPLANVKKMIQEMVERLVAEGNKEMGQEEYCDKQRKQSRDETVTAKNNLDSLNADIRSRKAAIEGFKSDLSFADSEVSRLQEETARIEADAAKQKTLTEEQTKDTMETNSGSRRLVVLTGADSIATQTRSLRHPVQQSS